ncbi:MAG: GDYXXLXY domain-containing protein [Candidatus Methylacidiphilales bacterium]
MVRNILFLVSGLGVFAALNYAVYDKQQVVDSCDSVYLKLAPVDPRSLMQGDYMRLDYELSRQAAQAKEKQTEKIAEAPVGRLIVACDKDGVASFVRFDDGTPLAAGEKYLVYHDGNGHVRLGAESYFFQEGDAKIYEKATYGELRVNPAGESVLMGLCDTNRQQLGKRASGL